MKKIYVPEDESELALLTGLLEAAEIPYYVNNEIIGNMYRFLSFGSQVYSKAIHVADCDEERAVKLIQEHIAKKLPEPVPEPYPELDVGAKVKEALRFLFELAAGISGGTRRPRK